MKEDKSGSKWMSIILGGLGVIMVIWIIYLRNSRPETSIKPYIAIAGILLMAFVVASFGKSISEKLKKLSSINAPKKILTSEEVDGVVYKIVEGTPKKGFQDGFFRNIERIEERKTKTVDGDEIYALRVRLSYPISFGGKQEDGLWIIINATHQSVMPSILREDTEDLEDEMNFKSKNYRKPTVTTKVEKNQALGFESTEQTVAPSSETKDEEEEDVV